MWNWSEAKLDWPTDIRIAVYHLLLHRSNPVRILTARLVVADALRRAIPSLEMA